LSPHIIDTLVEPKPVEGKEDYYEILGIKKKEAVLPRTGETSRKTVQPL